MKEISDKLAWELTKKLDALESFCDEKSKDDNVDWLTAGCLCSDIRVHLYHHMKDMIHHPDFPEEG